MSGTAEVLQEYLIKLGFQTDSVSLRKFEDGLSTTGKRILGMGTAVAATVVGVEAAAAAFAYSMRKIYFDSELSNTSVKNIKAMGFAGKQAGISSETMAETIKRANMKIFESFGTLKSYASAITGVNEESKETGQILQDLMDKVPNNAIGAQIMAAFGMDEETFVLWKSHNAEIKAAAEAQRKMYSDMGVDFEKSKQTIKEYAGSMDLLKSQLGIMVDAMMIKFLPTFRGFSGVLNNTVTYWTHWAMGIESVQKTLESLTMSSAWGFLKSVYKDLFGIEPEKVSGAPLSSASRSASGKINKPSQVTTPSQITSSNLHRNERNNNPGNIRAGAFANSLGAIGKDEAGFAVFPDMKTGFAASRSLLASYGKKGFNTVNSIIGRWAPSNENDTGKYSSFISKYMGVSGNSKLNMNDPATLSKLSMGIAKYEGMNSARLGEGAGNTVAINQTTNINVTGTGAEATGKAVAMQQSRVNGNLLRMTKGAVS